MTADEVVHEMDVRYAKDWLRTSGYHKSYYEKDFYAEMLVAFARHLRTLAHQREANK